MKTLLPLLALSLVSPATPADVPAWIDAEQGALCKGLRATLKCGKCSCEAYTQSNPMEDAADISDIPSAVVFEVRGVDDKGEQLHVLRAFLGKKGALKDAGSLAVYTAPRGANTKSRMEVAMSSQTFDMCPGMCPHNPVGLIHAFEVVSRVRHPAEKKGEVDIETVDTSLALCFAPQDGSGPAGCWLTPIGAGSDAVRVDPETGQERRGARPGWKRNWTLSDGGMVELTLGRIKGKAPDSIAEGPVGNAPKKCFVLDIRGAAWSTPARK